jgi:hypothetical protein
MIHLFQPFWSFINTQKSRVNGVSHCALLLHVAMQIGLYHLLEKGAWRKVSEDSGESRPFLLIDCTVRFSLPPSCLSDEYQQILSVSSI